MMVNEMGIRSLSRSQSTALAALSSRMRTLSAPWKPGGGLVRNIGFHVIGRLDRDFAGYRTLSADYSVLRIQIQKPIARVSANFDYGDVAWNHVPFTIFISPDPVPDSNPGGGFAANWLS